MYGGKSGAYYFLEEVMILLKNNGFQPSNRDPCLLFKKHNDNTHTLVALSSDDHILTASNQKSIDDYDKLLSQTYETKRLGFPEKYLGWHFPKLANNSIGISEPLLIDKLVHSMNASKDTNAHTPYVTNLGLHGP